MPHWACRCSQRRDRYILGLSPQMLGEPRQGHSSKMDKQVAAETGRNDHYLKYLPYKVPAHMIRLAAQASYRPEFA